MMEKNILFEESAVKEVLKYLKEAKGYSWKNINYVNKGRYCIVDGNPKIAILLKTEPFFNFGRDFQKFGESGVGDSINLESLKDFARREVKEIYTMFRDGKIYTITLEEFCHNSYLWQQKEGTWVKSISIHKLKRVNKEGDNV